MEKKKSLVSIIVPAYNAEKFIDKCIRSVLNQSYPNLELILVDDGSTDETGKICEEYASKDTRVRVIHKKNSEVSAARNMGLSSAIGEYVVFLDSDDWLDEDIVELALKKYQKNCINIWGFVCYWPRNVLKTEELRAEGLCQEELIANAIFTRSTAHYDLGNYFRAGCGKIYERAIIEENSLAFPEKLFIGEDAVFLVKYLRYVSGVNLISQRGYNYNHLNENAATTKYQKSMYEQSELQYTELVNAVKETGLAENDSIRNAFVNFRWWMLASLSMNSLRGFFKKKVFIINLTKESMRWVEKHREEMKESATSPEEVSPAFRNIYRYRESLSKRILYQHYFIPKFEKFIQEHMR